MESFIVVVSLIASAAGALILLTSLAGKKAQLAKAFSMQLKLEAHEKDIQTRINSKLPPNTPEGTSGGKDEN
ncbi:MAG: hypothetical protein IID32_02245 [Planctomycetes bacterium]|nr:hypothetical protein [Planctomycetota bacterium]